MQVYIGESSKNRKILLQELKIKGFVAIIK